MLSITCVYKAYVIKYITSIIRIYFWSRSFIIILQSFCIISFGLSQHSLRSFILLRSKTVHEIFISYGSYLLSIMLKKKYLEPKSNHSHLIMNWRKLVSLQEIPSKPSFFWYQFIIFVLDRNGKSNHFFVLNASYFWELVTSTIFDGYMGYPKYEWDGCLLS